MQIKLIGDSKQCLNGTSTFRGHLRPPTTPIRAKLVVFAHLCSFMNRTYGRKMRTAIFRQRWTKSVRIHGAAQQNLKITYLVCFWWSYSQLYVDRRSNTW